MPPWAWCSGWCKSCRSNGGINGPRLSTGPSRGPPSSGARPVAGFLLYLAAAILPFAACVWYAATPNHFDAPFTPRMIYPGVADICAGALYYFAALFVALRRGPWYGTRAFGFLAAVAGSFIVTAYYVPFYLVIEATVYLSLALFTAAWGRHAFQRNPARPQPWLARLAVVAVVFYGVTTLGAIADLIWSAFQPQEYYFGLQYIIDIDGRPLELERNREGHTKFTDLAGNPVDDPRLKTGLSGRNMINLSELTGYIGNNHGQTNRTTFDFGYRRSETYLETLYVYGQVSGEAWYYLPRERVFAGYNVYNRIRVGGIGQNGFVPGGGRVEPFHGRLGGNRNGQITSVVQFGSSVLLPRLRPAHAGHRFFATGHGRSLARPRSHPTTMNSRSVPSLRRRCSIGPSCSTTREACCPRCPITTTWIAGAASSSVPNRSRDPTIWNTCPATGSIGTRGARCHPISRSSMAPGKCSRVTPSPLWSRPVPHGAGSNTWAKVWRHRPSSTAELLYDKIGQEVGSKRLTQKMERAHRRRLGLYQGDFPAHHHALDSPGGRRARLGAVSAIFLETDPGPGPLSFSPLTWRD